VYIEYSSGRLAEASLSISEATHLFGVAIGRKYIQRVAILKAVDKFSQLYGISTLRLHQLKGPSAGEYSITLTGNYRLLIQKIEEDKVRVINVEDYHGN
jgi:plasmid maintenance system killer protein